jgi:predicted phage terminase large subunit-like protein
MTNITLDTEDINKIKSDRSIRRMLARKSHYWFFSIYLNHYIQYPFAFFHHQMFDITEDSNLLLTILVAFRGSGKSTLMTLSYPIWSIIGIQKKKFVLIVSQTQNQARLHLANIKKELEGNDLLKDDIGPFEETDDEWGANSIVISNYNARISAVSTEQSIRGIRHGQYRPDLIICDDIEDLNSVKTREGRERTFSWFNGEIAPVGDKSTKTIVVGNLLHEDCLIMKLKKLVDLKKLNGEFSAFPLLDGDENIAWHGKYKSLSEIETLKKSIASESAYYREYLLKIISDEDRLVRSEWIHYYGELPKENDGFQYIATGIDLAVSEKDSADFTAMVSIKVYGHGEGLRVYILSNPVNKRMGFPETIDTAISLSKNLGNGLYTKLFIEDVGYQKSLIQELVSKNIPAEGVTVSGQDKRSRLALVTHLIQQGKVLFPKHGAEELIEQLTGFGIEKHDDLADAFSLLLLKILEIDSEPQPMMTIIALDPICKPLLGEPIEPLTINTVF